MDGQPPREAEEAVPPPIVPADPVAFRRDPAVRLLALALVLWALGVLASPAGTVAACILAAGTVSFGFSMLIFHLRWWAIRSYMWRRMHERWRETHR